MEMPESVYQVVTSGVVYVVSSGDYSDYSIEAIFSTRELAEAYIKSEKEKYKGGYSGFNDIEEYPLDPDERGLPPGYHSYEVEMHKNGDVVRIEESAYYPAVSYLSSIQKISDKRRTIIHDRIRMAVYASDEKHAIKIANERRAQLIANGHWEKDYDEVFRPVKTLQPDPNFVDVTGASYVVGRWEEEDA